MHDSRVRESRAAPGPRRTRRTRHTPYDGRAATTPRTTASPRPHRATTGRNPRPPPALLAHDRAEIH
ncbi:hypothetical protein, partial [Streptomyces scabiei]|uniref:hypothetical protein n=1 Tax=Streptomyces scabiei TaxID=1930 RepID=UPI0039870DA3